MLLILFLFEIRESRVVVTGTCIYTGHIFEPHMHENLGISVLTVFYFSKTITKSINFHRKSLAFYYKGVLKGT